MIKYREHVMFCSIIILENKIILFENVLGKVLNSFIRSCRSNEPL